MNERQIQVLKRFRKAGSEGLHHRNGAHPEGPHHKTCTLLLGEGFVECTPKQNHYRITRLGLRKLTELLE